MGQWPYLAMARLASEHKAIALEGDADATRLIIDAQSEPVILVGHSYGGAVITEAGLHEKVAALVPIPFIQHPVHARPLSFLVPCEARIGGVVWRFPKSGRYIDGL